MAKTVQVLHVLGSMDPGGVETWLLHVLRNIDRDQVQFHICTLGPAPGLYANEVEKLGGRILRCPVSSNPWKFSRQFRRILREGHYDVVHSHVHLFSGAILRWSKAEGVRIRIAHSHTSRDDRPSSPARRCYRRAMKSWISRYATHGLAASRLAAVQLFGNDWERDRRFKVLHCGIDLSQFEEPVDRAEVRREFGIPSHAIVVGHLGRFVPAKNHRFFLDVAAEIAGMRPDVHFLLVGDGPLRDEIESRATGMGFNGNMHFAGARTDIPRLMLGAMDVFLFPSLWEGLPLALVEAQAAGLQCLVSDAVATEATILPRQSYRLSLSERVNEWAARTIELAGRERGAVDSALRALAQTDFCGLGSGLSDFYLEAVR